MKKFETPEIDVMFLHMEDIITSSSTDPSLPGLEDINNNLPPDQLPIG